MTTHNAETSRFRLHLWRGKRKYIVTFVILLIVAGLGVAAAQWFTIPNGRGHAYGKGKNAGTGLALTGITYTIADIPTAVGPSETGSMYAGIHNPNNFGVTVTGVSAVPADPITALVDTTCTAPTSTWTLTPFTGAAAVAANGDTVETMVFTTTADFPICLAGVAWSLPVDIAAVASP